MTAPFILDASSLSTFQRCRRRWLLDRSWRVRRQHPKSCFDRLLRQGVARLEAGEDAAQVGSALRTALLKQAAEPGLDFTRDPFTEAMEWGAMLVNVIEALGRSPLAVTRQVEPVELSAGVWWRPLARMDDSGTLHRWLTVDALDQDRLAAELHSWHTFGDMAATDAPLVLHVIEIGQVRAGRRHSPWVRAYAHPVIAGRLKFQRTGGRKLAGDQWRPVWITDMAKMTAPAWVDLMAKEGVLEGDGTRRGIIHHLQVREVAPAHQEQFVREAVREAEAMSQLAAPMASFLNVALQTAHGHASEEIDPASVPMSRPACDGWRPCPYQSWCYAPAGTPIQSLGLYSPRAVPAESRGATDLVSLR